MLIEEELYWDRQDIAEDFFEALVKSDAEKAGAYLEEDASLALEHQPSSFDASAMNLAVMGGNVACVDLLLDHGASPNDGSIWWAGSFSPLMTAIQRKDDPMIRHLIEKGAVVTAYEAAAMGDRARLKVTLERDPKSVNMRGGDGQTPLHVAANPEIAAFLLERGADLECKDIDHVSTPAQYAMDRPEVAEFLLSKGAKGDVFLYAALANPSRIKAHIANEPQDLKLTIGPDVFPTTPPAAEMIYSYIVGNGCTPLHVAAAKNRAENIRLLVDAGADPNVRGGYDDATPMHQSAWNDQPESIKALLECGADIDTPSGDLHYNSPLGWAIVGGSLEAVQALIELGAKLEKHHVNDAEAGTWGEFDCFSTAKKEVRQQIFDLLKNRAETE